MKTALLFPALLLSGLLAARSAAAQQVVQPSRPQPPQPVIQPSQPQPPRPQPVIQPSRPQPAIQPPRPPQPQPQPPRPPIQPQPPRPPVGYNEWRLLATIAVRQPYGQTGTVLNGSYTNYRYIKLKVSNMPLYLENLVVSYDYGPATTIPVRYRLVPGSDSHVYNVQRTGSRRIRRIDFSYGIAGLLNRANVAILGLR